MQHSRGATRSGSPLQIACSRLPHDSWAMHQSSGRAVLLCIGMLVKLEVHMALVTKEFTAKSQHGKADFTRCSSAMPVARLLQLQKGCVTFTVAAVTAYTYTKHSLKRRGGTADASHCAAVLHDNNVGQALPQTTHTRHPQKHKSDVQQDDKKVVSPTPVQGQGAPGCLDQQLMDSMHPHHKLSSSGMIRFGRGHGEPVDPAPGGSTVESFHLSGELVINCGNMCSEVMTN